MGEEVACKRLNEGSTEGSRPADGHATHVVRLVVTNAWWLRETRYRRGLAVDEEEEEDGEDEDEEEDEEGIEVEEFEYKGITYQRDDENNVYLDGEPIGVWNGRKIVRSA